MLDHKKGLDLLCLGLSGYAKAYYCASVRTFTNVIICSCLSYSSSTFIKFAPLLYLNCEVLRQMEKSDISVWQGIKFVSRSATYFRNFILLTSSQQVHKRCDKLVVDRFPELRNHNHDVAPVSQVRNQHPTLAFFPVINLVQQQNSAHGNDYTPES